MSGGVLRLVSPLPFPPPILVQSHGSTRERTQWMGVATREYQIHESMQLLTSSPPHPPQPPPLRVAPRIALRPIELPFIGVHSLATLVCVPLAVTVASGWALFRNSSGAWVAQDVLVCTRFETG